MTSKIQFGSWTVPQALLRKIATISVVAMLILSGVGPFADFSPAQPVKAEEDGYVYFGGDDATVTKMTADTETIEWEYTGFSGDIDDIERVGDYVYVAGDEKVVKLNDSDGSEVWSYTGHSSSTLAVAVDDDGDVYSASADNTVHKIDGQDGSQIWTHTEHTDYVYDVVVGSNGNVFSAAYDETVHKINSSDGSQIWEYVGHSDRVRTLSAGPDGTVYSGSFDEEVHKISADGSQIWNYSGHSAAVFSVVVGKDGGVYSGGGGQEVHKIDPDDGSQDWTSSTGSNVLSIESNAEGNIFAGTKDGDIHKLDGSDGSELLTYSHGSRIDAVSTSSSNDEITDGGDSTGNHINGTVENQDGQPVENATVTVTGIDREELDADADDLDSEAEEILNELEDPTPPNWSADRTLTGSDGLFTEADSKYVAAHPKEDWGLARYTDTPKLGNPHVQLPANEEIALSVWDPDEGGLIQDGVESDLPGGVDDETDIVVESIDHDGGTVDTRTIETDTTYDVGLAGGEHELATTELPAGFYRVYPEDNPETSYVIVVGDPQKIANTIRSDLKNEAGQLTAQAERVREYKNENVLKQYTTTTGPNGTFSVDVPDSVTRVSVQAHKTPPGMTEDPQNASLQDIRDYYAVTDYNGSYVMPAEAETHSVPADDITVDTVETEAPQFADLGRYANATEAFQALLQNLSYSELPSSLQQRLDELDRGELEETTERLQRLTNQNSELESRVEELADRDTEIEINDSSDEELREQIQAQQQAISELRSTIETGDSNAEISDGKATAWMTFQEDLSKDQVRVVAQFQNGTSREVPNEYLSIDQSAGTIVGDGGTKVTVEEYPIGDADGVMFDYQVASSNGIGKGSTSAIGPNTDNIGLDAISLSSLRPGPDEQVDVTLVGDDETQISNITNVRAVGSDGEELDTSTEGANTATFTTSGEGRHYVEVEFETASGEEGTLTHRIAAGDTDQAMPPGIRVKDTPFGTVAVVGDGYEAGSVDISNGGQNIDVTAQVGADEDAPARTHLYAHGTNLPPTSTLSVDIVRGDQKRAVQRHVEVTAHLPAIRSDNPTLYRNGEALPRDGEGKLADVSTSSDETTIVTVTDARGSLELKTNSNPGRLERLDWWLDRNTPEVSLGVLGQLPALPTVPVPDLTPVIQTGPMQVAAPAPTIDGPSVAGVPA